MLRGGGSGRGRPRRGLRPPVPPGRGLDLGQPHEHVLQVGLDGPDVDTARARRLGLNINFVSANAEAAVEQFAVSLPVVHNEGIVTGILTIVYLAAFAWFAFDMARAAVTDWEVGGSAWAQQTPIVVKVAMVLGAALMIVQMLSNILHDLKLLSRKG